jgi:hypothetical protein
MEPIIEEVIPPLVYGVLFVDVADGDLLPSCDVCHGCGPTTAVADAVKGGVGTAAVVGTALQDVEAGPVTCTPLLQGFLHCYPHPLCTDVCFRLASRRYFRSF